MTLSNLITLITGGRRSPIPGLDPYPRIPTPPRKRKPPKKGTPGNSQPSTASKRNFSKSSKTIPSMKSTRSFGNDGLVTVPMLPLSYESHNRQGLPRYHDLDLPEDLNPPKRIERDSTSSDGQKKKKTTAKPAKTPKAKTPKAKTVELASLALAEEGEEEEEDSETRHGYLRGGKGSGVLGRYDGVFIKINSDDPKYLEKVLLPPPRQWRRGENIGFLHPQQLLGAKKRAVRPRPFTDKVTTITIMTNNNRNDPE